MDHAAAARDIALLERMGYTRNEAIDLVIRRALRPERDVADAHSSEASSGHAAYLDELRGICDVDRLVA